jgi:hypothetical protein
MPAARQSSIPIWDPITAFGVLNQDHGNEFTCCSRAKSKYRRCTRHIAKHNQDAVLERIEKLSSLPPRKASRHLRNLAVLSSCPRDHHKEEDVNTLVNKWQQIIDCEQELFELGQRLQRLLENLAQLGRRLNQEEQRRLDQVLEDLDELDRNDQDSVDELVENFDRLERDLSRRDHPYGTESEPESESAASEEEDAITLGPIATQTIEVEPFVEPDDEEIEAEPQRLMLEQQSIGPASLHLAETTPRPPETTEAQTPILEHCREIHVSRRPTGEDCPICTASMADSPLRDLVWCKARCGRSVHRTCFEAWRSRSGQDVKCVYWYVSSLAFLSLCYGVATRACSDTDNLQSCGVAECLCPRYR